ncbi:hypothetical protein Sdia_32670 [Streptomyces diastaticus subsp. diastaticus]|uniref:Uncharacterized protein n=1 Tax=Streptomyces diastaticus subsp. diastaticus TaxID=68040 RepID=A0ABQ1CQU0_STRDI|nr:hypothetical protein Sdia_32670 [Streptomyces diastaticus subsp. diastaticus]GGU42445.1 hypothetical protein GCM10015534_51220 [Streptomyces diastaticus subsp. diastaticus]
MDTGCPGRPCEAGRVRRPEGEELLGRGLDGLPGAVSHARAGAGGMPRLAPRGSRRILCGVPGTGCVLRGSRSSNGAEGPGREPLGPSAGAAGVRAGRRAEAAGHRLEAQGGAPGRRRAGSARAAPSEHTPGARAVHTVPLTMGPVCGGYGFGNP